MPRREERALHALGREEVVQRHRQLDHAVIRGAREGVVDCHALDLFDHGLLHAWGGVAEAHVPQPTDGIQKPVPVAVDDVDTLGGGDDPKRFLLSPGWDMGCEPKRAWFALTSARASMSFQGILVGKRIGLCL